MPKPCIAFVFSPLLHPLPSCIELLQHLVHFTSAVATGTMPSAVTQVIELFVVSTKSTFPFVCGMPPWNRLWRVKVVKNRHVSRPSHLKPEMAEETALYLNSPDSLPWLFRHNFLPFEELVALHLTQWIPSCWKEGRCMFSHVLFDRRTGLDQERWFSPFRGYVSLNVLPKYLLPTSLYVTRIARF